LSAAALPVALRAMRKVRKVPAGMSAGKSKRTGVGHERLRLDHWCGTRRLRSSSRHQSDFQEVHFKPGFVLDEVAEVFGGVVGNDHALARVGAEAVGAAAEGLAEEGFGGGP